MRIYKFLAIAAATALATTAAEAATSSVEFPTEFFTPLGSEFDAPYRRGANEDWGWTQSPITEAFTSAKLNISAFDVDFNSGERDEIFVSNNGVLESLGFLSGADDIFSFTEFDLGADLFDDIAGGLEVFMDIDTGNSGWLVSLGRSVITTDGSDPGDPNPTPAVPLPASGLLLMGALGCVGAARRRFKKA